MPTGSVLGLTAKLGIETDDKQVDRETTRLKDKIAEAAEAEMTTDIETLKGDIVTAIEDGVDEANWIPDGVGDGLMGAIGGGAAASSFFSEEDKGRLSQQMQALGKTSGPVRNIGRGGDGSAGDAAAAGMGGELLAGMKGAGGKFLKVGLAGAVGLGILSKVTALADSAPRMEKTMSMTNRAIGLFARPFYDFLARFLEGGAESLLNMAANFNQIYAEDGLAVAVANLPRLFFTRSGNASQAGTAGRIVGGLGGMAAGAYGGAKAGAAVGGAAGSIIPGAGTAAGGTAGAIIGGVGGGLAGLLGGAGIGEWAAEGLADIDWGEVLNPVNWVEFLDTVVWDEWIVDLTWDTFIVDLVWDTFLVELVWDTFIVDLVWDTFIVDLAWGAFVSLFRWQTYVNALDWGIYIGELIWGGFIVDLVWESFINDIIWDAFIQNIVWEAFINDIVWDAFINNIVWDAFINDILWDAFINDIIWEGFIQNIIWSNFIDFINWGADFIPDVNWGDFIPTVNWGDFIPTVNWGQYIPDMPELSAPSLDPRDHLASGGVVTSPTSALIGEGHESEAVVPLSQLGSMLDAERERGQREASARRPPEGTGGGAERIVEAIDDLKRELKRLDPQTELKLDRKTLAKEEEKGRNRYGNSRVVSR